MKVLIIVDDRGIVVVVSLVLQIRGRDVKLGSTNIGGRAGELGHSQGRVVGTGVGGVGGGGFAVDRDGRAEAEGGADEEAVGGGACVVHR